MDLPIKAARIADQIRDYIALWSRMDYPDLSFSVNGVTMTPNLRSATIWIDTTEEDISVLHKKLQNKSTKYRRELSLKLGKRGVPALNFRIIDPKQALAQPDILE